MQVKQPALTCLIIGILLFVICVICILSGCKGPDNVVMTAKSPKGESASIVAYLDSVLVTYSADLIIRSPDGRVIQRMNLIRRRDGIEEFQEEFSSLEFKDDAVHLGAKGERYHGPNEFRFRN